MTLTFIEGFDGMSSTAGGPENAPKWIVINNPSWVTGRAGGASHALNLVASPPSFSADAPSGDPGTTNALIFGASFQTTTNLGAVDMITFKDSAGLILLDIQMSATGSLKAFRGASELLESSDTLSTGVWHYIEVKVLFSNTVGTVAFQIDGVASGDVATVDTIESAATQCDVIQIDGPAMGGDFYWDDIYIAHDNGGADDFLGACTVTSLYPNADQSVEFTRSGGAANFEMLDDNPPDEDVTYVESLTASHEDTFDFAAFGIPAGDTIHGVTTNVQAKKQDSGSVDLRIVTRSGGTEYYGAVTRVVGGWQRFAKLELVDPDTAVAWTTTGIDAAQFGFERN